MARIPQYEAQTQLDPAARSMPRANMDTSPQYADMAGAQSLQNLGKSLGQVGGALADIHARSAAKAEQQAEYGLRINEDRMIDSLATDFTEAQKNMPENGAGFAAAFSETLNKRKEEFFKGVPPEKRGEYELRWQQRVVGRYTGAAAQAEAKRVSEFGQQTINTFHEQAKVAVFSDPNTLDMNLKELDERIDKNPASWSAAERNLMKQQGRHALVGLAIEARAGGNSQKAADLLGLKITTPARREGGPRATAGPTGTGDPVMNGIPPSGIPPSGGGPVLQKAASYIARKEGFRTGTYWDVNHHRVGYGSDTITKADGSIVTVTQGMTVTRADADRDLARRTNIEMNKGRAAVGNETWEKLPDGAKVAIASVSYNYGKVPGIVAAAGRSGDPEQVAKSIEALRFHNNGVNASRRQEEADMARGRTSTPAVRGKFGLTGVETTSVLPQAVDGDRASADPRIADMPFEQRMGILRKVAVAEEKALRVAEANASRQAAEIEGLRRAKVDELQIRAFRGELTPGEVENVLAEGKTFRSAEEYTGIMRTVESKQAGVSLAQQTQAAIDGGVPQFGRDAKKGFAALEDHNGEREGLQKLDPEKTKAVIGRFKTTGLVSNEMEDVFKGMIQHQDKRMVEHAMSALDQMERANPAGFNQNMKELKPALASWRGFLESGQPDAFYNAQRRSLDPSTATADKARREEASKYVDTAMTESKLLSKFDTNGWLPGGTPLPPTDTGGAKVTDVLREDYRRLYQEAYALSGDQKNAEVVADEQIKSIWQVSDAAGGRLMRHAPETLLGRMALPVGETAWMREQVVEAARAVVAERMKDRPQAPTFKAGPLMTGAAKMAGVPLGDTRGFTPENITIVASPRTREEIELLRAGKPLPDGRESPGYVLTFTNPDTGKIEIVNGFTFDPEPARQKFKAKSLQGDAAERAGRQRMIEAGTMDGFMPPTGGETPLPPDGKKLADERDIQDESDGAEMRREQRKRRRE